MKVLELAVSDKYLDTTEPEADVTGPGMELPRLRRGST